MASTRYTPEEFVTFWMKAKTVQEVADHFQLSKFSVERIARNLRKAGVTLPLMRNAARQQEPLDIAKLNEIIKAS